MKILDLSNRIIEFSYYCLFFLVPLVFWKDTSELYELNKMWLTFALTILIAMSWAVKTIFSKRLYFQRTPLDIPIFIFLVSQVISTVFSLDTYVSLWGYYSRFNGGLLSIFSYIFLYYAFLSNFPLGGRERTNEVRSSPVLTGAEGAGPQAIEMVKRLLLISLASATIVALWGLPSHFGYDPTCLIFRGSFDVSCWTADFQPKVRIFSTLGQPAWLGAYLTILAPMVLALFIQRYQMAQMYQKYQRFLAPLVPFLLLILFYLDILFTKSRAALFGFWISIALFGTHYFFKELQLKIEDLNWKKVWLKTKPISFLLILFLILTAIVFNPIELRSNKGKVQLQKAAVQTPTGSFTSGGGGTESGKIRLFVWQGALTAWLHNPIFGTGVETFAFAYYKYKPAVHNLTSEWNYLYNKAHNEYLNFLATSGIVGLGSYLFIIGSFLYSVRQLLNRKADLLILALVAGYISILITNFFGFSVVIVNIYFFLIPAFVFVLLQMLKQKKTEVPNSLRLSNFQKLDILTVVLIAALLLLFLRNFWLADVAYSLGSNLSRAGEYISSHSALKEAVDRAGFEPTYKDELSSNDAVLAVQLFSQLPKDEKKKKEVLTFAEGLAKEAIDSVEQITREHPNNVVFLKTKVRVYYILSQIDPKYSKNALDAIKKAKILAPSDANIYYNLGLLYGQNNDTKKAVETLKLAIKIKPNYINAYYALGLFYRQQAVDKRGVVVDYDLNSKAIEQMEYILKNLDPNNQDAKEALASFQKNQ